jgi:hypothetical protein
MKTFAVLNDDNVLTDYIESEKNLQREDGYIEVDSECDLELNRYRYNDEAQWFDPLPKERGIKFDQHAANMTYKAVKAIVDSPLKDVVDFPPEVIEWIKREGK